MEPKYRNQQMLDKVDGIVDRVLAEKRSNKYRDHFFPRMINEMGYEFGAEIGVDKGGFSNHLLNKTKKLYQFILL